MSRRNYSRPPGGSSNSGHRVERIGVLASTAKALEDFNHLKRTRRMFIARKALKAKADSGDKQAQAKIIITREHMREGNNKARALKRAIYGEPNQTKVTPHCVRMQKRDPDTGKVNTLDLPINQQTLGRLLHLIAAKLPWRHLAQLTDEQASFLETGRFNHGLQEKECAAKAAPT